MVLWQYTAGTMTTVNKITNFLSETLQSPCSTGPVHTMLNSLMRTLSFSTLFSFHSLFTYYFIIFFSCSLFLRSFFSLLLFFFLNVKGPLFVEPISLRSWNLCHCNCFVCRNFAVIICLCHFSISRPLRNEDAQPFPAV